MAKRRRVLRGLGGSFVALAALLGCSDDRSVTDTPPDAALPRREILPAPPDPPDLGPCPDGWITETPAWGGTWCLPYPQGKPEECPAGEAHLPGRPGCEPIGSPCPEGDFAEPPAMVTGSVTYVLAGSENGDGSRARPFGTVQEAIDAGASFVLIGKGDYPRDILTQGPVELYGACVTGTRLGGMTQEPGFGVGVDRIRNLTVESVAVLWRPVEGDSVNIVRDLQVTGQDARFTKVIVGRVTAFDSAHIELAEGIARAPSLGALSVTGKAGLLAVSDFGSGVVGADSSAYCAHASAGTFIARRSSFTDCGAGGVAALGARHLLLDQVVIATVPGFPPNYPGRGIAHYDGIASIRRSLVTDVRGVGMHLDEVTAGVSDVVAQDTAASETGSEGFGIAVAGDVSLSRVRVVRATATGFTTAPGTQGRLRDIAVDSVSPRPTDGALGYGMAFQGAGTEATCSRCAVTNAHGLGVLSDEIDFTGTDLSIESVSTERQGNRFNGGIVAQRGSHVRIDRARIAQVNALGISAIDRADLSASELLVEDVTARPCTSDTCTGPELGIGVGGYRGSMVRIANFSLRRIALCGLHLARGGQIDASGGLVTEAEVGVCVEDRGYDVTRLTADNLFVDNQRKLDIVDLPVPDITAPVAAVSAD